MRLIDKLHSLMEDAEKAIHAPFMKSKAKSAYSAWENKAKELLLDAHLEIQKIRIRIAKGEATALNDLRGALIKLEELEKDYGRAIRETGIMFKRDAEDVQKEFDDLVKRLTEDPDAEAPEQKA